MSVSRRELYVFLKDKSSLLTRSVQLTSELVNYIACKLNLEESADTVKQDISTKMESFTKTLQIYWKRSSGREHIFLKKYRNWLDAAITIVEDIPLDTPSTSKGGRPKKRFEDSSHRTKLRKVEHLTSSVSQEHLVQATELSFRKSGKRNAAYLLKQTVSSPKRATKIKKKFTASEKQYLLYSPDEALNLMVRMNLTKHEYQIMRDEARIRGVNMYPAYNKIRQAKQKCYPDREFVTITDRSAEIKLQALVDHTTTRLMEVQSCVISTYLDKINKESLQILYKWGCDGSSSQSNYKQKYASPSESDDDSSVFIISLVPIQLHGVAQEDNSSKVILWNNSRPGSTRFCRPIRFLFAKESDELIRSEVDYIEDQIKNLIPTKVSFGENTIWVKHNLLLTMVDGKVCNSLTETSSQTCYICGATPKTMNKLDTHTSVEPEYYKFGLSPLHAHIRMLECLLHISYKLTVKKWQIRDQAQKGEVDQRKKAIQEEFKRRTSLIIDKPKQGSGTSNDGNTARRFFADPETSAEITGIDIRLIKRFAVILQTISSGFEIDVEKFSEYTKETAKLYNELYNWYYMPSSVHKILIHGADVIKSSILPIGQLSEEASEARNKHFRSFRQHHTRKISRIKTNEDLLHSLLVTSDPVISSNIPCDARKLKTFSPEVLQLIKQPEIGIGVPELILSSDSD